MSAPILVFGRFRFGLMVSAGSGSSNVLLSTPAGIEHNLDLLLSVLNQNRLQTYKPPHSLIVSSSGTVTHTTPRPSFPSYSENDRTGTSAASMGPAGKGCLSNENGHQVAKRDCWWVGDEALENWGEVEGKTE